MKNILLFLFVFVSIPAIAQDETYGTDTKQDTLFYFGENSRLLIFPFEPKLYMSDIDREIGENNGLNFQEIRGYFRLGLDNALFHEAKTNYDVIRMHADEADVNKDLQYVYKSTGYQYREVPKEEEEEQKKVIKAYNKVVQRVAKETAKLKGEQLNPKTGTWVEEGQVLNNPNGNEKFMAKTIINTNVFNYCVEKYQAGLFLFINQLDIKHAPGVEWQQYGSDDYPRQIKVHYSVFNKEGQEVFAGIAVSYFSSQTNSIKKIIVDHVTEVAKEVMKKVPVLVVQETEELLKD
tara:strand:+ start:580 stop:1455 length:876 start_codon:yes stop_codon:yes gene_type:complete